MTEAKKTNGNFGSSTNKNIGESANYDYQIQLIVS